MQFMAIKIFILRHDLLKFDRARIVQIFDPDLQNKYRYSNERKGTKNYGGIRMINWQTGQNFYFHNGWWHGIHHPYIVKKRRRHYNCILRIPEKTHKETSNVV
jgi:hypothetical protein